jgi:putative endonuclease
MSKYYCTYILTNKNNAVLYTGVTGNIQARIYFHKNKKGSEFTTQYLTNKLVYYEIYDNPETAIIREKKIKNLLRKKKIELINKFNPNWDDLYRNIIW